MNSTYHIELEDKLRIEVYKAFEIRRSDKEPYIRVVIYLRQGNGTRAQVRSTEVYENVKPKIRWFKKIEEPLSWEERVAREERIGISNARQVASEISKITRIVNSREGEPS
jgi:hypothetical protein